MVSWSLGTRAPMSDEGEPILLCAHLAGQASAAKGSRRNSWKPSLKAGGISVAEYCTRTKVNIFSRVVGHLLAQEVSNAIR